ncbi:unnamed protein product, partial [Symbiodinium microadriaticum]
AVRRPSMASSASDSSARPREAKSRRCLMSLPRRLLMLRRCCDWLKPSRSQDCSPHCSRSSQATAWALKATMPESATRALSIGRTRAAAADLNATSAISVDK